MYSESCESPEKPQVSSRRHRVTTRFMFTTHTYIIKHTHTPLSIFCTPFWNMDSHEKCPTPAPNHRTFHPLAHTLCGGVYVVMLFRSGEGCIWGCSVSLCRCCQRSFDTRTFRLRLCVILDTHTAAGAIMCRAKTIWICVQGGWWFVVCLDFVIDIICSLGSLFDYVRFEWLELNDK